MGPEDRADPNSRRRSIADVSKGRRGMFQFRRHGSPPAFKVTWPETRSIDTVKS